MTARFSSLGPFLDPPEWLGEVLDGLAPDALMGDEALPVLLAEDDLIGEPDLRGEELPLPTEDPLGGDAGLGAGKAGLRNSAHSL